MAKTPNRIEYDAQGNARSFVGAAAVDVFAMAVLATGLRLYERTGMQPNRAYTPRAMMAAAARHTGQTFKARDYIGAATALEAKVQAEKARIAAEAAAVCGCGATGCVYCDDAGQAVQS